MKICCYPEFQFSYSLRGNHQATAKINGYNQRYRYNRTVNTRRGAWRVARGAWRVVRGAWRVAPGAWLVALFIICKPVMSTLDNRNELISGCRHSKKFPLNTVLTWLVLVANLTCCKHHLITTHHAPTPRLAFIVLFYLMIRLARGMTL